MPSDSIVIDEEFEQILPPLTADEYQLLEQQLVSEGCRDSVVVWKGHDILLDGHNRIEICDRHELEYTYEEVELPDRDAAKAWIIRHARGQRNLTADQLSYLRGKQYELEKQQGERTDLTSGNSCPKSEAAERLAEEHNVSPRTIKGDAQFARAVDKVADNVGPEAKRAMLDPESKVTKKDVIALAELPKREQKTAISGGDTAVKEAVKSPKEKVAHPLSTGFLKLISDINATLYLIKEDHDGKITNMFKHRQWDKRITPTIIDMVADIHKTFSDMKKEIKANGYS